MDALPQRLVEELRRTAGDAEHLYRDEYASIEASRHMLSGHSHVLRSVDATALREELTPFGYRIILHNC